VDGTSRLNIMPQQVNQGPTALHLR